MTNQQPHSPSLEPPLGRMPLSPAVCDLDLALNHSMVSQLTLEGTRNDLRAFFLPIFYVYEHNKLNSLV